MSDGSLQRLAETAGISLRWRDFRGDWHEVTPDTLRNVLAAMGLPAATGAQIAESLGRAREATTGWPPLLTTTAGQPIDVPEGATVELEQGGTVAGEAARRVTQPGYHVLSDRARRITLAVAPRRCPSVPPPRDGVRPWGIAAQLYGLRRDGDGGIGDFSALRNFVAAAARHGADAVAISPVHAQFSADLGRFSPYAPSSRVMLNALHAAGDRELALEAAELVDWPRASAARLVAFRRMFAAERNDPAFAAYRREAGEALERHARFEALHAYHFGRDPGCWHWTDWQQAYHDPAGSAVAAFAREHADEVAFHAWLQFHADSGLAQVQRAARDGGMRIGLISDLAVGADSGGSHAWSRQGQMMRGLTIGAPPDLLNTRGQNWGISAFLPLGLRQHGFAAFIEMLRTALRHAGGVRIDHAMGLQRLWVIPDRADAAEGAYVNFPLDDMLRLIALEATRHGAIVLGEDLGTLPDGFQDRLIEVGILGMRVLWFERDDDHFQAPRDWSAQAAAMTTTHDLPTVSGWWRERDIDWRQRMGWLRAPDAERQARAHDRTLLWQAMRDSGAAQGEAPAADDPLPADRAALSHVARSACDFALFPLEDLVANVEQPNLPGTTDEHPNWCRRMTGPAAALLDEPDVAERLDVIRRSRSLHAATAG